MVDRPIQNQTLHELLTNGERLCRELLEHLEQGFLPNVKQLEKLLRHAAARDAEPVSDLSVRNAATAVLTSDDFTQELCGKLEEYLAAIAAGTQSYAAPA